MLQHGRQRNLPLIARWRQKGSRRELHQVPIAGLVLGQQGKFALLAGDPWLDHVQGQSGNRLYARLRQRLGQLQSREQVVVGHAHGRRVGRCGPLRQILGADHAL